MRDRLISAVILIAMFVLFYILGGIYFVALTSFVGLFAYKELIFLKKYPAEVIILGLVSILGIIILNSREYGFEIGINTLSVMIPIVFLTIPCLFKKNYKIYSMNSALNLIGFIMLVGFGISGLNMILLTNKLLLLYLVLIVVLNDSAAFIFGSLFGKHKFSKISPKKSIEGLVAGTLFGSVFGTIFYLTFIHGSVSLFFVIFVTLALNIACQVGDLMFSKIKREYEIKDFSNLLPGHGGILDRLDSILFTSLVFIIILSIFK